MFVHTVMGKNRSESHMSKKSDPGHFCLQCEYSVRQFKAGTDTSSARPPNMITLLYDVPAAAS